ncbi:flagellar motor protein MotA [Tahibacter soli]|uniref:Flagellar motor protein MotA n=1 Tax=Tahibacter soli TaxID=2983605 RepID=A0A9X3YLV6_9GAMM|nr:flagellar motor protein MotA [Tahibacter soli]MDC8014029.1 flagellar motor protein MotA [Tahibacter soli]
MTRPNRSLLWMGGFLAAVAVLVALIAPRLAGAFQANPFFNGVILAVLAAGIVVNLRQVLILNRDIDWIEHFRRANPDRPVPGEPRLLAPMARMLSGRERGARLALNPSSMRTLLDGVYLRLEESRDLSRYLIGLAIFLGLLGTFWGLLATIRSVSDIIGSLSIGGDAAAMFANLKDHLREPLGGMATSFSTSLFGLASSLVIGFLDLQAGHAQNRFYNEMEEWLSGVTKLSAGGGLAFEADASVPAYVQALLEQTADGLERMQRAIVDNDRERRAANEHIGELNAQLARLTEFLGRDARERHAGVEAQEELRTVLKTLASQPNGSQQLSDDLRAEFRLLSRTIAAAIDGQQRRPAAGPVERR